MPVKNRILKSELVSWKKFKFIQDKTFKSIKGVEYAKLRTSILNNDFVESFKVWQSNGDIYCLDGFHRCKVLRELEAEGHTIPERFRADFLSCKDKKEAAKLVLIFSSVYAKATEDGLTQFIADYNLDLNDLNLEIDLPDINLEVKYLKNTIEGVEYRDAKPAIDENTIFPSTNFLGIPDLKQDMMYEYKGESIGIHNRNTPLDTEIEFVNYGETKAYFKDKRHIISFYRYDEVLDNCYIQPAGFVYKYASKNTDAVCTINFTMFVHDPPIFRLWQLYKARRFAAYCQASGLKIVLDVEFSQDRINPDYEYLKLGLPKKIPTISFQLQQTVTEDGLNFITENLNKFIREFGVNHVFLYSGSNQGRLLQTKLDAQVIRLDTLNDARKKSGVFNKKGG